MPLIDDIKAMQKSALPQIPEETLNTMMAATEALVSSGIADKALKAGQQAPDFTLTNTRGENVSLRSLLAQGPVVINFYRGAWCPYCNLELKAYQDVLPAIKDTGATFISISPNLREKSAEFVAENPFSFDILSDEDNLVAAQFGLVFSIPDELRKVYDDFGINLPAHDGNDRYELPMPGTYIIDTRGTIIHAFVDADYTKRMEPAKVIEILTEHQGID